MPEGGQLGGRPNRAGNEARPFARGKLLSNFLGQLDGSEIDFGDPVLQAELPKHNAGCAECVCFNNVAADVEEGGVNVPNDVRAAQHQHFAAILLAPVIVQGGIALLDVGPHRPVVNDDAFAHGLEKVGHQLLASSY